MSDRFEAFKSTLSGVNKEFAERNRLAGAKAQETLASAREDFTKRMEYIGKVAARLDQRYKTKHAGSAGDDAPEGRSFGFEGWPADEDATDTARVAPVAAPAPADPAARPAPAAGPPATEPPPAGPPVTPHPPTGGSHGRHARQQGILNEADDVEGGGWLRG